MAETPIPVEVMVEAFYVLPTGTSHVDRMRAALRALAAMPPLDVTTDFDAAREYILAAASEGEPKP